MVGTAKLVGFLIAGYSTNVAAQSGSHNNAQQAVALMRDRQKSRYRNEKIRAPFRRGVEIERAR